MSAHLPAPDFRITPSRPRGWKRVRTMRVGLTTVVSGCTPGLGMPLLGTRTQVTGTVKAPAPQLGVTTQGFREGEIPVTDATVRVRSTDGGFLTASVQTDARGQFVLPDLTPETPLFLEATVKRAGGKTLTLSGYVRTGPGGTVRDLNTVSSLVASKLRTFTRTRLESIKTDDVTRLELTLSNELQPEDLPDLSDPDGLSARFDALSTRYGTIASSFGSISGGIVTTGLSRSLD